MRQKKQSQQEENDELSWKNERWPSCELGRARSSAARVS